jgi:hypothetical protein
VFQLDGNRTLHGSKHDAQTVTQKGREPAHPHTPTVDRTIGAHHPQLRERRPAGNDESAQDAHSGESTPTHTRLARQCLRVNTTPAKARAHGAEEQVAARERTESPPPNDNSSQRVRVERPVMILPQVHLRKPCYDFSFL